MAGQLVSGNPDIDDFFEKNFELKYIKEFRELIEKEGQKEAGRLMWAIWLTEDPDSRLYSLGLEVRRDNVIKHYLKNPDFDFSEYDWLVDAYRKYNMSTKARMYADYQEVMSRRHKYLMELAVDYSVNSKEIDDMMLKTKKIWDELEKIEKEYLSEKEGTSRTKGDAQESAAELGLI
jgi:hypothetical protein